MTQPSRIDGLPDLPPGDIGPTDDEFGYSQELVQSIILADRAAQAAKQVPAEARESDQQLMRFYSVDTLAALIDAQERHIVKLQAKLPPLRDEFQRTPRA